MKRRKDKNRVITTDADGSVVVTSTKKRVRLTVVMVPRKTRGTGEDAVTTIDGPDVIASAHLDDAAVDRLIARLMNIRGGRAARPRPRRRHCGETVDGPNDDVCGVRADMGVCLRKT